MVIIQSNHGLLNITIDDYNLDNNNAKILLKTEFGVYSMVINKKEKFNYIGSVFNCSGYLYDWFRIDEKLCKLKMKEEHKYHIEFLNNEKISLSFTISKIKYELFLMRELQNFDIFEDFYNVTEFLVDNVKYLASDN